MPLYDVVCPDGHRQEIYKGMKEGYPPCSTCGKAVQQEFGNKQIERTVFEPYYDEHLEAYLTSASQRKALMKEKGLREGRGDMDRHIIEGAKRWIDQLRSEGKPVPERLVRQSRERPMA